MSLLLLSLLALPPAQDGGRIPWRKDVEEAMAAASEKGLPMMLYFTSAG